LIPQTCRLHFSRTINCILAVPIPAGYIINRTPGKLQKLYDKRDKAEGRLKHAVHRLEKHNTRTETKINTRFGCGGEKVDAIRHYYQVLTPCAVLVSRVPHVYQRTFKAGT
jgi:hypothetical protein